MHVRSEKKQIICLWAADIMPAKKETMKRSAVTTMLVRTDTERPTAVIACVSLRKTRAAVTPVRSAERFIRLRRIP